MHYTCYNIHYAHTLVTMPASSWPGTMGHLVAQGPCLINPSAHSTSPWHIPQYTAQTNRNFLVFVDNVEGKAFKYSGGLMRFKYCTLYSVLYSIECGALKFKTVKHCRYFLQSSSTELYLQKAVKQQNFMTGKPCRAFDSQ